MSNPRCDCGGFKKYDSIYNKGDRHRSWVCSLCGKEGSDTVTEDVNENTEGKQNLLLG